MLRSYEARPASPAVLESIVELADGMLKIYKACPALLERILEVADSMLRLYKARPAFLFCAVCAVLESIWQHRWHVETF